MNKLKSVFLLEFIVLFNFIQGMETQDFNRVNLIISEIIVPELEALNAAQVLSQASSLSPAKRIRIEKFTCDYPGCKFTTIYKCNLTVHKKIHTGEKSFICDHPRCAYKTIYKKNLIRHQSTHVREKPFKCRYPACEYATACKDYLKTHQKTCVFSINGERYE